MTAIFFRIEGTHRGPEHNPLPKLKMTGRQSWTPRARDYVKWKEHVRASFLVAVKDQGLLTGGELRDSLYILSGPPIKENPSIRPYMDIRITWANEKHADPENVFGSIADALFLNDKHLAGSFIFVHGKKKCAQVEVTIRFENTTQ